MAAPLGREKSLQRAREMADKFAAGASSKQLAEEYQLSINIVNRSLRLAHRNGANIVRGPSASIRPRPNQEGRSNDYNLDDPTRVQWRERNKQENNLKECPYCLRVQSIREGGTYCSKCLEHKYKRKLK